MDLVDKAEVKYFTSRNANLGAFAQVKITLKQGASRVHVCIANLIVRKMID